MHKITRIFCISLVFTLLIPAWAEEHSRDEVRSAYLALYAPLTESPYEREPSAGEGYDPGALREEAEQSALSYVNFLRYLAYLDSDVTLDPLYSMRAQYGAVLLAANDRLEHDAPRPEDMPEDFYETAHAGTLCSNIASLNWMCEDVLLQGVEYFARDDGERNLEDLGHRRWLLNPYMGATGFGLAHSESGLSYVTMYAQDASREDAEWDYVGWPSRGAFPAELMSADLAWSVVLNPEVYDLSRSELSVSLREETFGEASLLSCTFNSDRYGAGPCLILLPDLAAMGITDYQQNQVWHFRLDGLQRRDGGAESIEYTVRMCALYPVDPASVELNETQLTLPAGETASLAANVIPEWADDLTVTWTSDHPEIAAVDETGTVTACAPGACHITAEAVNGRTDVCEVTVTAP